MSWFPPEAAGLVVNSALLGVVSVGVLVYRYVRLTTSKAYKEMVKNDQRYRFLSINSLEIAPPANPDFKWRVIPQAHSEISKLDFEGNSMNELIDKMMEFNRFAQLMRIRV